MYTDKALPTEEGRLHRNADISYAFVSLTGHGKLSTSKTALRNTNSHTLLPHAQCECPSLLFPASTTHVIQHNSPSLHSVTQHATWRAVRNFLLDRKTGAMCKTFEGPRHPAAPSHGNKGAGGNVGVPPFTRNFSARLWQMARIQSRPPHPGIHETRTTHLKFLSRKNSLHCAEGSNYGSSAVLAVTDCTTAYRPSRMVTQQAAKFVSAKFVSAKSCSYLCHQTTSGRVRSLRTASGLKPNLFGHADTSTAAIPNYTALKTSSEPSDTRNTRRTKTNNIRITRTFYLK